MTAADVNCELTRCQVSSRYWNNMIVIVFLLSKLIYRSFVVKWRLIKYSTCRRIVAVSDPVVNPLNRLSFNEITWVNIIIYCDATCFTCRINFLINEARLPKFCLGSNTVIYRNKIVISALPTRAATRCILWISRNIYTVCIYDTASKSNQMLVLILYNDIVINFKYSFTVIFKML